MHIILSIHTKYLTLNYKKYNNRIFLRLRMILGFYENSKDKIVKTIKLFINTFPSHTLHHNLGCKENSGMGGEGRVVLTLSSPSIPL